MEKSNLTITEQTTEQGVKLEAAGYIVYDTAAQFEKVLNDSLQHDPKSVIVDMEKVAVFTSIGIRVVLKFLKLAKERKFEFKIENPSDIVRNVLMLSNLDKVLVKV